MLQSWKFGFVVSELFVGAGEQDITLGNVVRCIRPTKSSIDKANQDMKCKVHYSNSHQCKAMKILNPKMARGGNLIS